MLLQHFLKEHFLTHGIYFDFVHFYNFFHSYNFWSLTMHLKNNELGLFSINNFSKITYKKSRLRKKGKKSDSQLAPAFKISQRFRCQIFYGDLEPIRQYQKILCGEFTAQTETHIHSFQIRARLGYGSQSALQVQVRKILCVRYGIVNVHGVNQCKMFCARGFYPRGQ